MLIVLAILFGGAIIAVTLYLNRESHTTTSSTASEVTTDNPTGEESAEEGTKEDNSVAPVSYTLKGTCDGTPFQVVLTRFGHGGINGDYKNLDSGTKMKLDGTWEGGNLEFTGRIQKCAIRVQAPQQRKRSACASNLLLRLPGHHLVGRTEISRRGLDDRQQRIGTCTQTLKFAPERSRDLPPHCRFTKSSNCNFPFAKHEE